MRIRFRSVRALITVSILLGATAVEAQTPNLGGQFPLYVVDARNDQVLQVNSNGTASVFITDTDLGLEAGFLGGEVALDASNNLYVSAPPIIWKITPTGQATEFFSPIPAQGLAFDSQGNLWGVAIAINGSAAQVFELNSVGSLLNEIPLTCLVPVAVAFDQTGSKLYVSCADGTLPFGFVSSILAVALQGGGVTTVYSGAPLKDPYGMAFDSSGNLFIADLVAGPLELSSGTMNPFGQSAIPLAAFAFGPGALYGAADVAEETQSQLYSFNSSGDATPVGSLYSDGSLFTAMAFTRAAYTFSGFLSPIANPPDQNTGHPGRTFPIKFQLQNSSGAYVSSLSAVTSVTSSTVNCSAFSADPSITVTATTSGSSGLKYDPTTNEFIYNWASPSQAGCYSLTLTLSTGQTFSAYFDLK